MDWCQADKDYINKKRSANDKTELVFVLKCFFLLKTAKSYCRKSKFQDWIHVFFKPVHI